METEIKIAPVLPHQAALVLADPRIAPFISRPRRLRMRSEYFDTPGRDLLRRKFVLRLRSEDGRTVCAFKAPAPQPGLRLEIEIEAQSLAQGVAALLVHPDLPPQAAPLLQGDLHKLCSVSFVRELYLFSEGGLELELCVDQGQCEKGPCIGSICELELELKSGTYDRLSGLADYICSAHGLEVSPTGKLRQALALGEGGGGRAVNPFFVGAEMLNFCVRSKYIELVLGEDKQLRYTLTPLGERELPARFGVSFDKPCAFTDAESQG